MVSLKQFLLFFGMVALTSCVTIEKRRYADGFYLERASRESAKAWTASPDIDNADHIMATAEIDFPVRPDVTASSRNGPSENPVIQMVESVVLTDTLPPPKKRNPPGNFKDDAQLDVTKKAKNLEVFSVVGFVLAFFAYSLFWFTPVVGILPFMLAAFLCSALGIYRTRKKKGELNRPMGRILAIAGLIASGLVLLVYAIFTIRGLETGL